MTQITDEQIKRIASLFGAAAALINQIPADAPEGKLAAEWMDEYGDLSADLAKPTCRCIVGPTVPGHWHLWPCPLRTPPPGDGIGCWPPVPDAT
jgi:hypothetical protein